MHSGGHALKLRPRIINAFVDEKVAGGLNGDIPAARPKALAEQGLVVLEFDDFINGQDLSADLEKAFGPDGMGALVIANIPGYVQRRRRLLPLARAFARLSPEAKARYEDPESHFSVGWSHGKEQLADGALDTNKGSFYANPLVDDLLRLSSHDNLQPWLHEALSPAGPTPHGSTIPPDPAPAAKSESSTDGADLAALREQYPGYYRANVWPREELPELELALKDLGRLMCAVGCLLADHCDSYVAQRLGSPRGQRAGVLRRSLNPKARLLHYFPAPEAQTGAEAGAPPQQQQEEGNEHEQPWCGWHTDHGSLTGLTAAMYLDAAGNEVPAPDPKAGLYIRNRHGQIMRAGIPADCMAFQVGEALQVHSGGLLRATPHYVRAAAGPSATGVSRNTFAVFMQPNVTEPMDCPAGVDPARVAVGQWRPGFNFGEFAEATFERYYPNQSGQS